MSKIFNPQAKIIVNSDRVMELIETGNTPPVLVEIDPSNACNHNCSFCWCSHIHFLEAKSLLTFDRSIMPEKMLIALCRDLSLIGARAVTFTGGGEPTMNPHLGDAIRYLGKFNIKMGMFTNGTLLDKFDLFNPILDYLTWIRVSVDAGTENTYKLTRLTRDWYEMLGNLDVLCYMKKMLRSQTTIGVGFVVTPSNYEEIIDFANMFSRYEVDYCQYKPEIINHERGNGAQHQLEFWVDKVQPLLAQAKIILGDKFQVNEYKMDDLVCDSYGRDYKRCLGSQLQPCVGADGGVYVCVNLRMQKEYSYGNIKDRSFIEIWNDVEHRQQIMRKIEEEEQFCNCTMLCKSHESNKRCWEIDQSYRMLETYNQRRNFRTMLRASAAKVSQQVIHPEFI